jgi:hypothetical protein
VGHENEWKSAPQSMRRVCDGVCMVVTLLCRALGIGLVLSIRMGATRQLKGRNDDYLESHLLRAELQSTVLMEILRFGDIAPLS